MAVKISYDVKLSRGPDRGLIVHREREFDDAPAAMAFVFGERVFNEVVGKPTIEEAE